MTSFTRYLRFGAFAALFAAAGVPAFAAPKAKAKKPHLTPARLADLATKPDAEPPKTYHVEISDLGEMSCKVGNKAVFEVIREHRYPIEFDPPQAGGKPGDNAVTPTTPTAFDTTNTGWTVEMEVKIQGKVFELNGVATFTELQMINGAYGELAGPIQTEDGKEISPNVVQQPVTNTTTTRFHLYALPGEPYEVIFYRGNKAEKRTITVTGAMR